MPGYHRQHAAFTIAVLLSSISTGFLAYLSFEEYVVAELRCAITMHMA